jgi:N-acetylmuramoyl-L-alanine amidase
MHGRSDWTRYLRAGVLLVTLVSAGITAVLAAGPVEPHHVTAVRFWSLGAVTRIAIETDGDFEVKSDRLDNPDRLFFDLSPTKPNLSQKSLTVIPVSDRLVRQIRVAEPQHNITRVVLDLETQVEPTLSRLDNPSRLIIELRAKGTPRETTTAPLKSPPTLVAPAPAPKPAERRPFTPPPAAQPIAIPAASPQEAWLDAPPELPLRSVLPPVSSLLAVSFKTASAPPLLATPSAVLAKPALPSLASAAPSSPAAQPIETAQPAKRNTSGDRSMIRVLGLKVGRIVLDPGHGGHDTGTVGPGGLREKDLVLDVAQRLGRLIETRMGSEVIFTRTDDTFVPLERRTEIANEAKADLFLSIHANSSPLRSAAGVETYYLNFTTSKSALDLASRENSGSQLTVYELQGLLEKIALKDKAEESREFASRVQAALYNLSSKTTDVRSKDRGVKRAPFVVLIGASMPSVLAEIGFVSNAHDESVMRREEYHERTAEALFKGISSYASSLSHFQVAQRH